MKGWLFTFKKRPRRWDQLPEQIVLKVWADNEEIATVKACEQAREEGFYFYKFDCEEVD